jgi:hypothetical protein
LFTSDHKFHLNNNKKRKTDKKNREYGVRDSKQTIQNKVSTSLKKKRKRTHKESVQRKVSFFLFQYEILLTKYETHKKIIPPFNVFSAVVHVDVE